MYTTVNGRAVRLPALVIAHLNTHLGRRSVHDSEVMMRLRPGSMHKPVLRLTAGPFRIGKLFADASCEAYGEGAAGAPLDVKKIFGHGCGCGSVDSISASVSEDADGQWSFAYGVWSTRR
jgi:hypothetical protein